MNENKKSDHPIVCILTMIILPIPIFIIGLISAIVTVIKNFGSFSFAFDIGFMLGVGFMLFGAYIGIRLYTDTDWKKLRIRKKYLTKKCT